MKRTIRTVLGAFLSMPVIFFMLTTGGCGGSGLPEIGGLPAAQGGMQSEVLAVALKPVTGGEPDGITYYEAGEINRQFFTPSASDEPLTVTAFGPEAELPREMRRPDIYIAFNQPMVPLSKLGEIEERHPFLKIDPPLEGRFRWYGSRLLAFEPSADLEGQRSYRVSLKKGIASLGGRKLEEELVFSFHTEYLDFAVVHPGLPEDLPEIDPDDVPPKTAKIITCEFTYPVEADYLAMHLQVRAGGVEYPFTLSRPETGDEHRRSRTLLLNLNRLLPEESEVRVILKAGAASGPQHLERRDDSIRSFHTLNAFKFNRMRSYSYSFPRSTAGDANPVFIEFSHPLDAESVLPRLSTSLDLVDLEDHLEIWNNTLKLNNLPVEYESSYMVYLDAGVRDIYGRTLDEAVELEVEVGAASRYYYFPDTGSRMLEAAFENKIIYEYQNVFDGVWKIGSVEDPYSSFSASELSPYDFSSLPRNVKHYEVLDLSPYLNDEGFGTVGISWNFGELQDDGARRPWEQRNLQLQVTDIGITSRIAYNKVLVRAASLADGSPLAGAKVELLRNRSVRIEGVSDETGLAVFEFDPGEYRRLFREGEQDRLRIRVSRGADSAEFVPNGSHNQYHFGIYSSKPPIRIEDERMEAFIFTDRGLYKKGETVTFRGIDRSWSAGRYDSYQGPYSIEVSEQRYRAEPFHKLQGTTSTSGGFHGSFGLPDELEPGSYWIIYRRGGHEERIGFTVAEFRRAEFEVRLSAPERLFYASDTINMRGKAQFLSGGDLAGAPFSALWMREPVSFKPPGREWRDYRFSPRRWAGMSVVADEQGALDGSGGVLLSRSTGGDQIPGIPYRYQLELGVQDQARQELADRESVLVHPADFYVGSRFAGGEEGYWSTFVKAGEEIDVESVLVYPDGRPAAVDPAGAEALLLKRSWQVSRQQGVYGRLNNRYELVEDELSRRKVEFKRGRTGFSITAPEAGQYLLRISAEDAAGRTVLSEISFYATGSSYVQWNQSDPEDIELVPDRDEYAPGETARLLVKSPLPEGRYLLTIEREGIIEERLIELTGSASEIEIPVRESFLPVVYVALSTHTGRGASPKSYFDPDLGKPKGLFGIAALKVSPESRALEVSFTTDKELYRPGEAARARVKVTSGGRPVEGAEVTFLAVDRGVVDLIDYHVPDPMEFFYADYKFPLGVTGADSRSLLINPVTYEVKDLQGGDGDEGKLERRKDFSPLAVFEPYLLTGADGTVVAGFTFPDTLTTYRATAVAVKENRFGRVEQELKVRNPLTLRTALPRRLRLRDTALAGVIVTNLSSRPQEVEISCESAGDEIEVSGEPTRTITLDPGETREIPFTLLARHSGTGKLEFSMRSGLLSEILEATLPVEHPLIAEAFTIAGTLEDRDSIEEGLVIPSAVAEGFGDLTLRLSPNPLSRLSGTVERLLETDYEILEGEMFRILPQILLGEKLDLFDAVYNRTAVQEFIGSLKGYQNRDGGFGYRPGSGYSSPYLSVRLAHYLVLASGRGISPDRQPDRERLLTYLRGLAEREELPLYTAAYALYLRTLMNDRPEKELASLYAEGDKLGLSGYAFLALAYDQIDGRPRAEEIGARMIKFVKLGTRSLDLTGTYESRFYFDSELTQLALLQMVLRQLNSNEELLDKAGRTLSERQRYGRWGSLEDSAWVLISYAARFDEFIKSDGRLDGEVRLSDQRLLSASSEDPDPVEVSLPLFTEPLASLPRNTLLPLTFVRRGTAPLFYSSTIRYALPAEAAPARDEGFSVWSSLETLDGEPAGTLKAGETYRMRVVVSSARDRSMSLLKVPVPSGCEIVDAALVTSRSYREEGGSSGRSFERETVYGDTADFLDEGYYYPDSGYFLSLRPEQKLLDNEVRYYFRHFYAGKESLDFLVRATMRGTYPTPPAVMRGIYEEETFGRAAGRLVVIE